MKALVAAIALLIATAVLAQQQDLSKVDLDSKVDQAGTTGERFINQLYAELGGK